MHLQSARHLKSERSVKVVRARSRRRNGVNLKPFLHLLFLLVLGFALVALTTRFNSETEALTRESATLERMIHRQERYIANFKVRIAALKGRVILARLKRFGLKLHNPLAGQVRRLDVAPTSVETDSNYGLEEPKLLVSRR